MKAVFKRIVADDRNLELIQSAIQSALDQTTLYQAKTPGNWASPAPVTLYDAIDRLAAVVKTLNGGNPIP